MKEGEAEREKLTRGRKRGRERGRKRGRERHIKKKEDTEREY